MVYVRPELSGCPLVVICLGNQAGEFADKIRKFREGPNVATPGIEQAGANAGLASVIKDELHGGAAADELHHRRQHGMLAANLEIQANSREFAHAADEFGPGAVFRILLVLEMMSNTPTSGCCLGLQCPQKFELLAFTVALATIP